LKPDLLLSISEKGGGENREARRQVVRRGVLRSEKGGGEKQEEY
jgi:hypothetical protein